jgi:hypothetical protein
VYEGQEEVQEEGCSAYSGMQLVADVGSTEQPVSGPLAICQALALTSRAENKDVLP